MLTSPKLLLCVSAFALSAATAVAQYGTPQYGTTRSSSQYGGVSQPVASKLVRHVNKDGRFEALMPPNAKSVTVPGKEITDTKYVARASVTGGEYKLQVQVISPIDLDAELNKGLTDMYVGQAREQQEKAFGPASTDKAIKQHGMQGQDFVYNIPASRAASGKAAVFRQRVLFDGKRLYIASLSGSPDVVNSTTSTEYLDSVRPMQVK